MRKDTDWDSLSGVDESENVEDAAGADDTGVVSRVEVEVEGAAAASSKPRVTSLPNEARTSLRALEGDESRDGHEDGGRDDGNVVGTIVPHAADRGRRATEREARNLVAANPNPNGWHPDEWGSTLEADMEVVIQMEHCGFVTLEKVLERHALSALAATSVLVQVLRGLSEVHSRGLMHRDIKPANLFITQEGGGDIVVKVGDFGLSTAHSFLGAESVHVVEDSGSWRQGHRLQHTVGTGTPTYMAPEQMGGKYYSEQCDIYAVGVVYLQVRLDLVTHDVQSRALHQPIPPAGHGVLGHHLITCVELPSDTLAVQMVAGFKTLMERVDALDAAGRISEMCHDPQQIPLPESVCAHPRIAALIRQTLAYAPDMRPSAAAALDEAVSIWRELLRDRKTGGCGKVQEEDVDAICGGDWEDSESLTAPAPGHIDSRLFARWSRLPCSGRPVH